MEIDSIESKINSLKADLSTFASDNFSGLDASLTELEKLITEQASVLPAYSAEKFQREIRNLRRQTEEIKTRNKPKRRFLFKSKKDVENSIEPKKIDILSNNKILNSAVAFDETTVDQITVAGKCGEELYFRSEINKMNVVMKQLKDCCIRLFGSPGTVHLSNIINCKVICGPVSRSVLMEECNGCTFVMAAQQFRIHMTLDCDFYILVTSKAIIEDSKLLRFAPYCLDYSDIDNHFKLAGLDKTVNNWDVVEDFNWLSSNKKSPNWSIIPEEERLTVPL